jgi:hypothetical protein
VEHIASIFRVLATCLLAGFAEHIFSTLKMVAICSSEMSVETERTTRHHIPEDDTLQIYVSFRSDLLYFFETVLYFITTLKYTLNNFYIFNFESVCVITP